MIKWGYKSKNSMSPEKLPHETNKEAPELPQSHIVEEWTEDGVRYQKVQTLMHYANAEPYTLEVTQKEITHPGGPSGWQRVGKERILPFEEEEKKDTIH